MSWQPIDENTMIRRLQEEVVNLLKDDRRMFERYRTPLKRIPCSRSQEYGEEMIFVVAQFNNIVIIFDDVEDDYGIAAINEDKPISSWRLYGNLQIALKAFIDTINNKTRLCY